MVLINETFENNLQFQQQNLKKGLDVTIFSIVINCALIVLKLIAGIIGNSFALVADAIHSMSDLVTDVLLVFGLKIAAKPRDVNHLYGHGKIENYVAHVIGVLLVILAVWMGFSAVKTIYVHIEHPKVGLIAIIAAVVSIMAKEYLYRITVFTGKKIKTQSMIANAWHHRSDAFSSVAALFGVGCAYFYPNLHIMDQYMGLIIAVFVVQVGFSIAFKSFKDIIDTSPSLSLQKEIIDEINKIEGVKGVHNLRARYYSSSIFLDIHVNVNSDITVKEGHDIAEKVSSDLLAKFEDVIDVTIHIEPED